jgi:hypothetical protein
LLEALNAWIHRRVNPTSAPASEMKPDDPVWGGYQRENACQAVVDARDAAKVIVGSDYIPKWAHHIWKIDMCMSAGPTNKIAASTTWGEELFNTWNDLRSNRGTLVYFQGILHPVAKAPDGQVRWEYREPKLRDPATKPVFKVLPE